MEVAAPLMRAAQIMLHNAPPRQALGGVLLRGHRLRKKFHPIYLLLAVPYAPMHEACEPAGATAAGDRVSPFAALAQLKRG